MPIGRKQDSTYLETPPSLGTPLIPPTVHLAGDAANRKSHPPRGRGPNSYFRICSQDKGHIWGPGGDQVQRSILFLISLTPTFSVPPERKAPLVPPPSSWTLHILRCLSSSWPLTADRPGPSAHTSSLSSDVPKSALASTRGQHRFHFGFCLWKAEESDTYVLPFLASLGSGTAWSRKLHLISVTSLTRPGETR